MRNLLIGLIVSLFWLAICLVWFVVGWLSGPAQDGPHWLVVALPLLVWPLLFVETFFVGVFDAVFDRRGSQQ